VALAKQAKILSKAQQEAVLASLASTRYSVRVRVIFLLSVRAGLRAKEIAALKWEMITDAEGELADVIALTDDVPKDRRGGRANPIAKDLMAALGALRAKAANDYRNGPYVVMSEQRASTSSHAVANKSAGWYRPLGLRRASSHGGPRTAIMNWARRISTVGVRLREIQISARHSVLSTTTVH
jgi:integrase/recombinase XerD